MRYLLPLLSFDMPCGVINSSFCCFELKTCKMMTINTTRRDSSTHSRGVASIEPEEALASSVFSKLMNNYSPLIFRRAPTTTMKW